MELVGWDIPKSHIVDICEILKLYFSSYSHHRWCQSYIYCFFCFAEFPDFPFCNLKLCPHPAWVRRMGWMCPPPTACIGGREGHPAGLRCNTLSFKDSEDFPLWSSHRLNPADYWLLLKMSFTAPQWCHVKCQSHLIILMTLNRIFNRATAEEIWSP